MIRCLTITLWHIRCRERASSTSSVASGLAISAANENQTCNGYVLGSYQRRNPPDVRYTDDLWRAERTPHSRKLETLAFIVERMITKGDLKNFATNEDARAIAAISASASGEAVPHHGRRDRGKVVTASTALDGEPEASGFRSPTGSVRDVVRLQIASRQVLGSLWLPRWSSPRHVT